MADPAGSRILLPDDVADSRMAVEFSASVWGRFFVTAGTARTVIGTAVLVKAHLIASVVWPDHSGLAIGREHAI